MRGLLAILLVFSFSTASAEGVVRNNTTAYPPMPEGPFQSTFVPTAPPLPMTSPRFVPDNHLLTPLPVPEFRLDPPVPMAAPFSGRPAPMGTPFPGRIAPMAPPLNRPWLHRPPPPVFWPRPQQRFIIPPPPTTPPGPPQNCISGDTDVRHAQQLANIEAEVLQLQGENSTLTVEQENLKALTILTEASMAALSAERNNLQEQLKQLQERLDNNKQHFSQETGAQLEKIQQLEQAQSESLKKDNTIGVLKNENRSLQDKLSQMKSTLQNDRAQSQTMQEKSKNKLLEQQNVIAALKSKNSEFQNHLTQTQGKLQQAGKIIADNEKSVTANMLTIENFKRQLQDQKLSLTAGLEQKKTSLAQLKTENSGLQNKLASLTANLKKTETSANDAATRAKIIITNKDRKLTESLQTIEVLNKKLQDQKLALTAGLEQKKTSLTQLKNENSGLQNKLASLTANLKKTETSANDAATRAKIIITNKDRKLTESLQTIEVLNKKLQDQKLALTAGLEQKKTTLAQLKTENSDMQNRFQALSAKLQKMKQDSDIALSQANSNISEKKSIILEKTTTIDALNAKLAGIQKSLSESNNSLEACLNTLNTEKATITKLNDLIASLQKERDSLTNMSKDDDNDGVINASDKCPNTETGRLVNTTGCEPDADNDGLADRLDLCPTTPSGSSIDEVGCANSETITLEGVNFKSGSSKFTAESLAILDAVVDVLKRFPELKLEVAGHTDNIGSSELNRELSGARALAVKNYLTVNGIEADRLTAAGYGPDQPIADNASSNGRAMNRRVELRRIRS